VIDLRSRTLWVRPDSMANVEAARATDPIQSRILTEIGKIPSAVWLTGSSTGSWVDSMLDKAGDQLATFVVYNIPNRDVGGDSAGGAADVASYTAWARQLAAGIQGRVCEVVIEPDSLTQIGRLSAGGQQSRYACLNAAVDAFVEAGAVVWIDVGDSGWVQEDDMAEAATRAGVHRAAGTASNVSHFRWLKDEDAFNVRILELLGNPDLRYIVDTSRCGRGPYKPRPGEDEDIGWRNPVEIVGLGPRPTVRRSTVHYPRSAGLRWIKGVCSSDGGEIPAGKYHRDQTNRLYHRANPKMPVVW
jgi:endoglucanase